MTKKIIKGTFIAALMGIILFIYAGTSDVQAAAFSPAGTYSLTAISNGGQIANSATLKAQGVSGTLILNADNTGQIVIYGRTMPMVYTGSTIVTSDGSTFPCVVTPTDITFAVDQTTSYAFSKIAAAAATPSIVQSKPLLSLTTAPSIAGTYSMTGMSSNGQTVGASDLALVSQLGFGGGSLVLNADGTGVMDLFGATMPLTYNSSVIMLMNEAACTYSVRGNTITVAIDPTTAISFSR